MLFNFNALFFPHFQHILPSNLTWWKLCGRNYFMCFVWFIGNSADKSSFKWCMLLRSGSMMLQVINKYNFITKLLRVLLIVICYLSWTRQMLLQKIKLAIITTETDKEFSNDFKIAITLSKWTFNYCRHSFPEYWNFHLNNVCHKILCKNSTYKLSEAF